MRRSRLNLGLVIILLASIIILGSNRVAWASSQAAPLGQTVPTRPRSTTTFTITSTSEPPQKSSATTTFSATTPKPSSTPTSPPTSTHTVAPTSTPKVATTTLTIEALTTVALMPPIDTALPQPPTVKSNDLTLPATGGLLLVLLVVIGVIIWRNRARSQ